MKNHAVSISCHIVVCTLAVVLAAAASAAQQPPHSYPSMAPLSQYLMPDQAEIALARSAAPASISSQATVLVLKPHGYVTAVEGKNGFVCVVERAWMSPFDSPQFWNPKLRGPICFNPQAAKSILPITYKRTELVLTGQSKEEIRKDIEAAFASKQLPPLEPGAMSYMMSRQGYLDDQFGHWISHLMFYTATDVNWGADQNGSPVMLNPQFHGEPEPVNVLMIPAGKWSDGTPSPAM
ncbi:hypothetical protein [Dyella caseinilytica]|uniref:Uncharacterized protein n=1 Tax=Dyella caseinilytica TaxID=1849581 RepID=A0ABX7GRG9_9GAMM|nr:hypothetical protein [Dyella caseinilytica]QRN52982.1 hypothetical protein ISN74_16285 [Dyella caseinilytica]GGA10502.1 hypothetical protein GCM10011408_34780 [Dyella caseinilytica]